MPGSTRPDTIDSGLSCVALVARLLGVPADPDQLRHRLGDDAREPGDRRLLRCARLVGLKARAVRGDLARLARLASPAIARMRGERYVIVGRANDDGVLVQDPLEARPRTVSPGEFETQWTGDLILLTRRARLAAASGRFGIAWFVPEIVRYRALLADVLVASFFVQLLALATPLIFQVVIDKVLVHKGLTTLTVLAVGLLAVAFFEVLLSGLRTWVFAHTTNRIDVTLGAKLYRHVLALPLAYFENRRVGDTVARVRELETIRTFITSSSLTLVVDSAFTIVFFVVMFWYSPALFLVVLGSVPAYLALGLVVTPVLRARLDEKFARGADSQAFLVESVSQIATLKTMAVEPQMQRHWEDRLAAYVRAAYRATNLGNVASQAAAFVNKVVIVLILWIGARLVIEGELSVGQLVAFNMLAARVSGPILRLVNLWQDFQQARIALARLGDVLDTPAEPGQAPDSVSLPPLTGAVRFEHVTFRYGPDRPEALADVSLDIAPGEVIGVVGRSGSGKSTLVRMLLRMHAPEGGRVLVDGVDVAVVDPLWLRRQIGVVPQESRLFNRTVRENIALADPGLPVEQVVRAATLAGAHEFILALPQGYDTMVGEDGCTLSGGQRQRIAIARALVGDPRILVLDEATSALDYESEAAVHRNMASIAQGRTVFVIAHRLSAVRGAGRIVVMEGGRVAEIGAHAELIERGGRYAGLHAMQSEVTSGAGG